MRAEDAAVDVGLVDHHVAEVREDVTPAIVIRQQADVHEIRVREDHVGAPPDSRPLLAGGVAVVDRGPQVRQPVAGEGAELILGQRLRRVEVEGAELRLARKRVENRQVERQRLARRGAGRHQHVLACLRSVPGVPLVAVQLGHGDRLADALIEVRRQFGEPRLARPLDGQMGKLLPGE